MTAALRLMVNHTAARRNLFHIPRFAAAVHSQSALQKNNHLTAGGAGPTSISPEQKSRYRNRKCNNIAIMFMCVFTSLEASGRARRSEKRVAPVIREHFFQLIISSGFMLKCTRNGTSYVIIHLRCSLFVFSLLLWCAAGCIFNKRTELSQRPSVQGNDGGVLCLSLSCALLFGFPDTQCDAPSTLLKAKPAAAPSASSRKRHDITSCEVSLYPLWARMHGFTSTTLRSTRERAEKLERKFWIKTVRWPFSDKIPLN